jgi:uncharacterized membrane protein
MSAAIDLDELTRQTRRQEFADGLNDLQTGLVILLLCGLGAFLFSTAGMTLYVKALIWNRELTILGLVALLGLFAVVAFGARRFIHYLRGKVLWKDQGQAVPLRVQVRWPATAAATGVVMIFVVAGLMYAPVGESDLAAVMRLLAATSGVGTGILYLALGRELGLRRLQWAGLAGGLLSAVIFFLPLTAARAWLALGILWAATLFVSGGLALKRRLAEVRSQHG